jgi:chromosome segregation ATPase
MKKFLTLLFVLAFYFQGEAQPKINRAPAPAAAVAPVKPKGPIPYLLKKDFDEILMGLKTDISKATSSNNSLRNSIASKDAQIDKLSEDLKKIEETLNSTSMEVENTSDSLNKTRFSLEELQRINDNHFVAIENAQAKTNNTIWIAMGIAAVIAFLISLVFNFLSTKKIHALKKDLILLSSKLESAMDSKINSVRLENKEAIDAAKEQQQFYAERLVNSTKNEIASIKLDLENVAKQNHKQNEVIAQLYDIINTKEDKKIEPNPEG